MIDATIRGSLILLAALAALRLLRHRSAAERELVLRCAILAMLVLSAIAATVHASLVRTNGAYARSASACAVACGVVQRFC